MTFCKLLILLMFTSSHDYTSGVRAADVVLQKLKDGKVRPADLAKALDVDRSTASLMLSGKRGIPTWHLDAIAQLLSVPVPELFVTGEMSRRRQSDINNSVTSPHFVTGVDAQWPVAGSASTGDIDASTAARRLSTPEDLRTELEAAQRLDNAAAIIDYATRIIRLAGGTTDRPDVETPPIRADASSHDPRNAEMRKRRTGGPLKRRSGGRS